MHAIKRNTIVSNSTKYVILFLSLIEPEFHSRMVAREIVQFKSRSIKLFGQSFSVKAMIRHHGAKIEEGHFTVWLHNVANGTSKTIPWLVLDDQKCLTEYSKIVTRVPNFLKDVYVVILGR